MPGEIDTQAVLTALLPTLHADSFAHLTYWTQSQLVNRCDEAVKRLSREAMVWIERDSSISTAKGTGVYSLPARAQMTIHASLGTTALRPAAVMDLEARDENFQSTPGPPDHWYEDDLMLGLIGLCPVPTGIATVNTINTVFPPDLDAALENTLVQAPAPVGILLSFAILAAVYGQEGESEQPDLAEHCAGRADMLTQALQGYFGKA